MGRGRGSRKGGGSLGLNAVCLCIVLRIFIRRDFGRLECAGSRTAAEEESRLRIAK